MQSTDPKVEKQPEGEKKGEKKHEKKGKVDLKDKVKVVKGAREYCHRWGVPYRLFCIWNNE